MLFKSRSHELDDVGRQFSRQLQKATQDLRCVERAVHDEDRRLLDDAGIFAIVDRIVGKALSFLPADRALMAILAIGQLKADQLAIVCKPDPQILFV